MGYNLGAFHESQCVMLMEAHYTNTNILWIILLHRLLEMYQDFH